MKLSFIPFLFIAATATATNSIRGNEEAGEAGGRELYGLPVCECANDIHGEFGCQSYEPGYYGAPSACWEFPDLAATAYKPEVYGCYPGSFKCVNVPEEPPLCKKKCLIETPGDFVCQHDNDGSCYVVSEHKPACAAGTTKCYNLNPPEEECLSGVNADCTEYGKSYGEKGFPCCGEAMCVNGDPWGKSDDWFFCKQPPKCTEAHEDCSGTHKCCDEGKVCTYVGNWWEPPICVPMTY